MKILENKSWETELICPGCESHLLIYASDIIRVKSAISKGLVFGVTCEACRVGVEFLDQSAIPDKIKQEVLTDTAFPFENVFKGSF